MQGDGGNSTCVYQLYRGTPSKKTDKDSEQAIPEGENYNTLQGEQKDITPNQVAKEELASSCEANIAGKCPHAYRADHAGEEREGTTAAALQAIFHKIPQTTADHFNFQTRAANVTERATKHKGPYKPMVTTKCNSEKIVNYTIKTAPNKRSHLNNRLQGSIDTEYTCNISVYQPALYIWIDAIAEKHHPLYLEKVDCDPQPESIPPPHLPSPGSTGMGITTKQQEEIAAMRHVYTECKKKAGKNGKRYMDPHRYAAKTRWQDLNPQGLMLTESKIRTIEKDLDIGDSFDSGPPKPKSAYQHNLALTEGCLFG